MAPRRSRRPKPAQIQADRHALIGIQSLPDYAPLHKEYSPLMLADLESALTRAQQDEVRALQALTTARDATAAAETAFHEAMLGAKAQVLAQYGADSPTVQLLGLKRRSERRRPSRRADAAS